MPEHVTEHPLSGSARPRLLDVARDAIRRRHYSNRTEETYLHWMKQLILFSGKRHPRDLGAAEVTAFLNHLVQERQVAAATQNQALRRCFSSTRKSSPSRFLGWKGSSTPSGGQWGSKQLFRAGDYFNVATPPFTQLSTTSLARVFQSEDSLRYRSWEFDEQEMALVVEVVLAAFIHDAHEVILGGLRIRNDPVDLAWNERRLVVGVVDTQSKRLCRLFHNSSRYLLIFMSRFPIP